VPKRYCYLSLWSSAELPLLEINDILWCTNIVSKIISCVPSADVLYAHQNEVELFP
jgi:hypothetical protein